MIAVAAKFSVADPGSGRESGEGRSSL